MATTAVGSCNLDNHSNNLINMEIFFKNAHFFLEHADEILADKRISGIPIPIDGHLAYVGAGGLKKPTLGTFVKWWQTEEDSRINNPDGSFDLIFQLIGSPLSGCNKSKCVDKNGNIREVNTRCFTDLCESFAAANRKALVNEPTLPLEELVRLLHAKNFLVFCT